METAHREYAKFIKGAFGRRVETPWEKLRGVLVLGGEKLWEKAREVIG
jgi:hypothetical protein